MHHCELPELDKQQARNMERTYELRTLKQATGRENEQQLRTFKQTQRKADLEIQMGIKGACFLPCLPAK
jgi:hypothetical protein